MRSTASIARIFALLLLAVSPTLSAQTVFVRPQFTALTPPTQTTLVGTPFPQRIALRLTNEAGIPLSGVLVSFLLSRCIPAPSNACPDFAPALDNGDPLFDRGHRYFVAVRTDAEGVARASTIVAGTQPMEAFVVPWVLPQDTPWGRFDLQYAGTRFHLHQVASLPVPALSPWLTMALLSACFAAGLIRLRSVRRG